MKRDYYTKQTFVAGTGADLVLAQSNPDRVAVWFACDGGQAWNIVVNQPATTTNGQHIANQQEQGFSDDQYPSLAAQEWHGISAAVGGTMTVWEIIRNPGC